MRKAVISIWLLAAFFLFFACKKEEDRSLSHEASMNDKERVFRIDSGMPSSLDPSRATGSTFHTLYAGLFQGLVISDPKTTAPIPGLAESWEISPDGKTYTFLLRENLKWSDGVELTAGDFVYSWKRILNPETASNYAWFPASVIKGAQDYLDGKTGSESVAIKALDKRRFQVEFVSPLAYIMDMLTHYTFGAIAQHVVEKYGDDWVKPENYVSSGPYKMSDWRWNEYIDLVANPYFYDQSQVTLDKVRYIVIENSLTAYSMYLNDEIDWLQGIPYTIIDSIKERPDVYIEPYLALSFYNFNTEKPPLDDIRVRKALSIVIDKKALTTDVFKTGSIATNSLVPPMEGYSESFPYEAEKRQENIKEAQQLLAEAGYPNGEGMPALELYYNTSSGLKKLSEFLQEQWRTTLGVEVELFNMEWKTFLEFRSGSDFDIVRNGRTGNYQDPSTFLDLYVSEGSLNASHFKSAEYDELLKKARFSSGEERHNYLKQAEAFLVDSYAVLPLYFYVSTNMIDLDKWEGWYPNIMDIHYLINIQAKY